MSSDLMQQREPGLAAHVSRLAHSGLPAAEFYARFLDTLPTPPGTLGTVAWACAEDSFSKLAAGSRTHNDTVQLPVSAAEHAAQLHEARNTRQAQIFDPPQPSNYQVFVENAMPTIVIFPVIAGDTVPTVVEAYLPPDVSKDITGQFVAETQLLCDIASNFHATSSEATEVGGSLGLTPAIYESLSVRDTCFAIANEGRRAIGCDRVTVLTKRGHKYKVGSVSGQESVNPRANLVQYLQRLVNLAMRTGEPFWYPETAAQLPPEIEQELEAYLEVSMARRLGILPLQVTHAEREDDDHNHRRREEITGAIVIEQFTDSVAAEAIRNRTQVVVKEGSVALRNATDHEAVFLLPLWRWVGGLSRFFRGNLLPKTLASFGAMALAILALIFIPAELKVASEGRLMPEIRRNIFAPTDGRIDELHVNHDSHVKSDDILATLRSPEQELAIEQTLGEIRKLQEERSTLTKKRLTADPATTDPEEMRAADAREVELRVAVANLQQQVAIRVQQQQEMSVKAPIDGTVITWDLEQRLQDRPVEKGQVLMQVAQLEGPWILELHVPDRKIADVLQASQKQDAPLKVTYRLASDTSQLFEGTIREIAMATRVDADQGQNVLVRVAVDKDSIIRQPFTGAQAKIHCGKRPLGVVWLRDVWHFIKSNIWFRLT